MLLTFIVCSVVVSRIVQWFLCLWCHTEGSGPKMENFLFPIYYYRHHIIESNSKFLFFSITHSTYAIHIHAHTRIYTDIYTFCKLSACLVACCSLLSLPYGHTYTGIDTKIFWNQYKNHGLCECPVLLWLLFLFFFFKSLSMYVCAHRKKKSWRMKEKRSATSQRNIVRSTHMLLLLVRLYVYVWMYVLVYALFWNDLVSNDSE